MQTPAPSGATASIVYAEAKTALAYIENVLWHPLDKIMVKKSRQLLQMKLR